jgi:hypothetical protein
LKGKTECYGNQQCKDKNLFHLSPPLCLKRVNKIVNQARFKLYKKNKRKIRKSNLDNIEQRHGFYGLKSILEVILLISSILLIQVVQLFEFYFLVTTLV